jgi:hypothetical protein
MFHDPLHALSASVLTLPGPPASRILIFVLTIAAISAMRAEQRSAVPRGI